MLLHTLSPFVGLIPQYLDVEDLAVARPELVGDLPVLAEDIVLELAEDTSLEEHVGELLLDNDLAEPDDDLLLDVHVPVLNPIPLHHLAPERELKKSLDCWPVALARHMHTQPPQSMLDPHYLLPPAEVLDQKAASILAEGIVVLDELAPFVHSASPRLEGLQNVIELSLVPRSLPLRLLLGDHLEYGPQVAMSCELALPCSFEELLEYQLSLEPFDFAPLLGMNVEHQQGLGAQRLLVVASGFAFHFVDVGQG